jgi:hypothetical protein
MVTDHYVIIRKLFYWVSGVRLLYQARVTGECGAVCVMRSGGGNRSSLEKISPRPYHLPQIPQELAWDRTWSTAVGGRPLIA